jgi:uncharacterized protein (DUF2141 family)
MFRLSSAIKPALLMLFCVLFITSAVRVNAQSTPTSKLTVQVTGLRNANGQIRLSLYRDSNFVEERQFQIDAKSLVAKTVFDKLPRATYAVYLFQDENMNGKMDTSFFGIPKEGYGASNNPHKRAGKPGFDETNFPLNTPDTTLEISMIYW